MNEGTYAQVGLLQDGVEPGYFSDERYKVRADGRWGGPFPIPADAPTGTYSLSAACANFDSQWNNKTLKIRVTPEAPKVATPTTVPQPETTYATPLVTGLPMNKETPIVAQPGADNKGLSTGITFAGFGLLVAILGVFVNVYILVRRGRADR